jgi:hypothetical protein
MPGVHLTLMTQEATENEIAVCEEVQHHDEIKRAEHNY